MAVFQAPTLSISDGKTAFEERPCLHRPAYCNAYHRQCLQLLSHADGAVRTFLCNEYLRFQKAKLAVSHSVCTCVFRARSKHKAFFLRRSILREWESSGDSFLNTSYAWFDSSRPRLKIYRINQVSMATKIRGAFLLFFCSFLRSSFVFKSCVSSSLCMACQSLKFCLWKER